MTTRALVSSLLLAVPLSDALERVVPESFLQWQNGNSKKCKIRLRELARLRRTMLELSGQINHSGNDPMRRTVKHDVQHSRPRMAQEVVSP